MLIEKVWAKINGNYEFTIGGSPTEVYEFLGGCPSITYSTSSLTAASAYTAVANAMKNKYLMGASCC